MSLAVAAYSKVPGLDCEYSAVVARKVETASNTKQTNVHNRVRDEECDRHGNDQILSTSV